MLTAEKMATNHNDIRFRSDYDQTQFENTFASIEESSLIHTLCISHVVNEKIAEFATGIWKICQNIDCNREISVLHGPKGIIKSDAIKDSR